MKTCYICGKPANSVEHVPAKSFFPKGNRSNLITVDSCSIHNGDTSKDDEYVRNIIAMNIQNNTTDLQHFINKVVKSFKKSQGLAKTTLATRKKILINGTPTFAVSIDRKRFEKVIKKIAYGIYFYVNRTPLDREWIILSKDLLTDKMKLDELGLFLNQIESTFGSPSLTGTNPSVFQYAVLAGGVPESCIIKMVFYEGFSVWATVLEGSTSFKL